MEDRIESGKTEIDFMGHKITTCISYKQCDTFKKALEDKDVWKAHMLLIPVYNVPYYLIESRMNMIRLTENYKTELKRTEEMSEDMLRVEMEMKYGKPKKSKRKLFGFLNI